MCGSFPGLLIGRTAVHSGKDPAFVAYDQFLSTGILQPLSRGEVRCGSCVTSLPVHTARRNCTGDEGGPFEFGNQVLISSYRKLLSSKAMVVNVAETLGHDPSRHG